jgi:hypothetical protein
MSIHPPPAGCQAEDHRRPATGPLPSYDRETEWLPDCCTWFIGANTTMFILANSTLFRPLPYPDSELAMMLREAVVLASLARAAGLGGAWMLSRATISMLYNVGAPDVSHPPTMRRGTITRPCILKTSHASKFNLSFTLSVIEKTLSCDASVLKSNGPVRLLLPNSACPA